MIFATYLGYWLMGAMLIAIGMVASLLSSNVTVAFILGALFSCRCPSSWTGRRLRLAAGLRRQHRGLSIPAQFHDFGTGVISAVGGVLLPLAGRGMLYINMVLAGPAALGRG